MYVLNAVTLLDLIYELGHTILDILHLKQFSMPLFAEVQYLILLHFREIHFSFQIRLPTGRTISQHFQTVSPLSDVVDFALEKIDDKRSIKDPFLIQVFSGFTYFALNLLKVCLPSYLGRLSKPDFERMRAVLVQIWDP